MAEKLDPRQVVTFEELLRAMMYAPAIRCTGTGDPNSSNAYTVRRWAERQPHDADRIANPLLAQEALSSCWPTRGST